MGHAKSGKVRTYLCVKKRFWLELTESKHPDHCGIVTAVAEAIAANNFNKTQAKAYLNSLLETWLDVC